jgi:hypothetical protein
MRSHGSMGYAWIEGQGSGAQAVKYEERLRFGSD